MDEINKEALALFQVENYIQSMKDQLKELKKSKAVSLSELKETDAMLNICNAALGIIKSCGITLISEQ